MESLDAILDNPLADQQSLMPATERYIYTKKKPTIDRDLDANIPGMKTLWESIDRIEHTINVNEGKVEPDEDTQIIPTSYRLYQLKHQLIDLKRHQYYLKDAYKPTLHFLNLVPPSPQTVNWDSDTAYWITREEWEKRTQNALTSRISKKIEDYETNEDGTMVKWVVREQNFDWENPKHIKCLIDNYSNIYMQLWDKPYSWGRTLLFDFDRYFSMCDFSPVREYILTRRIDRETYINIMYELEEKFGIKYNENHICTILTTEIPTKMAREARKHRLLLETPMNERKRCWTCKKVLPRDTLFFGLNAGRSDGWSSNCKECERARRIRRGGQTDKDARNKDKSMH